VRCGYGVTDITAGLFAVIGILMALRHRDQTGQGQHVDVSMLDSMISAMTSNYMGYLGSGVPPAPMGTSFPTVAPYCVFQGEDRSFAIAIGSEKLWSSFCVAMGRKDLEAHPDFATNALRVAHRPHLETILSEIFRRRSAADWLDILHSAGIPCSLVRNFPEVVQDPHVAFREMFPAIDHPTAGQHRVTGPPVKMSETPGRATQSAPRSGAHTGHALMELLDLDPHQIDELALSGVIFATPHK
jgi:crotonobetainyl-CoA:carnitine CoA-transferase CaiB-like acyl-CoA transferase